MNGTSRKRAGRGEKVVNASTGYGHSLIEGEDKGSRKIEETRIVDYFRNQRKRGLAW